MTERETFLILNTMGNPVDSETSYDRHNGAGLSVVTPMASPVEQLSSESRFPELSSATVMIAK